jgi:ATP-dependent Lon protease
LPSTINESSLETYVGKPVFSRERLYEDPPPGICMGLAWTSMGGATLYIETVRVAEKKNVGRENKGSRIKVTGSLGDVMRESTDIAWSYVRNLVDRIEPDNQFFDSAFIHVHVPSGATPKDGPSAGCAMVTSMMSLALGIPVRSNLAMTGEVTLTGKVLPVGGIREKTIAAKRSGVQHLVLPEGNRKDWAELPEHVRDGLEVYFAEQYDEHVMPICFPDRRETGRQSQSSPAVAA